MDENDDALLFFTGALAAGTVAIGVTLCGIGIAFSISSDAGGDTYAPDKPIHGYVEVSGTDLQHQYPPSAFTTGLNGP
jgi:hypothetical protein